ncbi:MAG: ClpXP protease specificity-enhancing factor [Methyloprofundus sp.]|nr:ClpXP protease specificity-enhancing factor [Methyloprofundus sp.]
MTPLKPYLIRSIYEWVIDNQLTPHLLVDATHPQAVVPEGYVEDDRIVLNVRPEAIQGLSLGNALIEFSAYFNGQPMNIQVPVVAVLAVYAKENGKGMVFDPEEEESSPPEDQPPSRPHLRVVK